MSPVCQIQELEHIKGSSAKAAELAGLEKRHFLRLKTTPGLGTSVRMSTRRQLNAALEEVSPFPLTLEHLRHGRSLLVTLKSDPGSLPLRDFLCSYGELLNQEPDDDHSRIQFGYMRMMIASSKALYHGKKATWFNPRSEHLQQAQREAEGAIKLADQMLQNDPDNGSVRHLRAILFINWTQIIQEQVKAKLPGRNGKVMSVADMQALFRKENALGQLKQVVENFPYLWTAAYNGLEQSSMLQDDRYALWFYGQLKRMDCGFQDFDYSPGELVAISAEPGMAYFHDRYRKELHTTNPVRSRQQKDS